MRIGIQARLSLTLAFVLADALGCTRSTSPSAGDGRCEAAARRLGYRVCVERVDSTSMWSGLAGALDAADQLRSARYVVPARDGARLPTLFEDDAAPSRNHFEFLRDAFADLFPALTLDEYEVMTTDPERRELFGGTITEYVGPGGEHIYGYVIWDRQDVAGTVSCAQAKQVQAALTQAFSLTPQVMVPATSYQRAMLGTCGIPTYDPQQTGDYEAYNAVVGYGTVRRYTLTQFQQAALAGDFGWQDILVIDEAPIDVESVVSGLVTGTRQGELSHLNVRSASRGTPNCYKKGALVQLSAWEGQLVRVECAADELLIAPAVPGDAQAWWAKLRPMPVEVAAPDWSYTAVTDVHAVPTMSKEDRALALRRFGGKGHNLATLYQRVDPALAMPAFLIPFSAYRGFFSANGLDQRLAGFVADPQFLADGAVRRKKLLELQTAIDASSCDPMLLADLATHIRAVIGSPEVMVRFRSSSNAEDGLQFNGAGLYASTSACLADDLDADGAGPSRCDAAQPKERGLCRALKKVWGSLWSAKAFEERAWYGIDQSAAAMAILVDVRTDHELANVVAFSGNPLGPDRAAFLVDAQVGAFDVVSADPGVWPEKDILSMQDGHVASIQRARASSQVGTGQVVLGDEQLRELGGLYSTIVQAFPIDDEAPAGKRILLDSEWKLKADGRWMIKQIRPFLDSL